MGRKLEILTYSLVYIINTGLYLVFHQPWVNFTTSIVGIFGITLLYSRKYRMNIFVTVSIYLVNMVCDTTAVFLFVNYQAGKEFNQMCEVLTILLFFLCVAIVDKIIEVKECQEERKSAFFILVPVISISILLFLAFSQELSKTNLVIVEIGILIINFLMFYLYNELVKYYQTKCENEILSQQVLNYSNQIDQILTSEQSIKSLRHDMKHHMNELKILARKGDTSGIESYIDDMTEYIKNPDEIIASGNQEIDSVLNYMLKKAKQKLKEVKIDIKIPEKMSHSFDINIIFGNLLENAIEASEKTEEKKLYISAYLKQGVFKVEVHNSCQGKIKKGIQGYLSTKRDSNNHGNGLKSVKKIVEKYNGIISMEQLVWNKRKEHFIQN
ncbi:MAG: GHKL domain-containing protein [Lachnospiraceae bacterium]|nr:GHKL domain-containing protein [Lachnospiraceae bacterium]